MQIEIDLSRPLIPGIFLPRNNLPHLWISLRYEKLADVCYRCGLIGHESHVCHGSLFFIRNPFGHEFIASGPWLKVENTTTLAELFHKTDHQVQPATTDGEDLNETDDFIVLPAQQDTSSFQVAPQIPCQNSVPRERCTSRTKTYQATTKVVGTYGGTIMNQLAISPLHIDNPSLTPLNLQMDPKAQLSHPHNAHSDGLSPPFPLALHHPCTAQI